MTHSIKILDVETLSQFLPVKGTCTSSRGHDQIAQDIARSIREFADFSVNVQLFRENGEHLQGDEQNGTMIVIRD